MTTSPDAKAQTSIAQTPVQKVAVTPKRKVTYSFEFPNDKNKLDKVRLPYAVAINGKAVSAAKPKRVETSFTVMVEPGSQVSLFLNSDAHPAYRKQSVYAVTPKDRDVHVQIKQKWGKHSNSDTPRLEKTVGEVDYYSALLTGDIWMKVSHKYTEQEADAFMPSGIDSGIREAVLSIYRGLKQSPLIVACTGNAAARIPEILRPPSSLPWEGKARPAQNPLLEWTMPLLFNPGSGAQKKAPADSGKSQAIHKITVEFENADNPKNNITQFSLLTDGLSRVHPRCFLALFSSAFEAKITQIEVSSNWRPLIGSIAHRAGLGLDVTYIENANSNLHIVRSKAAHLNAQQAEEASRIEKTYIQAKQAEKVANKAWRDAETAYKLAKLDPTKVVDAQKVRDVALQEKGSAIAKREESWKAWQEARTAHLPAVLRSFRAALQEKHDLVYQVFDPWLMDSETRDDTPPATNLIRPKNSLEWTHRHHLHLTAVEPDVL
ncbi:hypothetical protein [Pyxidicoccus caerfyrddinensis]|uniref:hypothetical protein n=1 Tax=Pyxidicoccus caerfyrddinensis TaxID=2709663 RepID=UPI0013DCF470|nr:hypothetical protein [Pyxidicoccus caerfyrddinensis]